MALLGSINKVSGLIGTGIAIVDSLFQKQVIITPAESEDDNIVINVVENEDIRLSVDITEKPVADKGATTDYISRKSTPLVLTGQISNRSLDLGSDPVEFLTQNALSLVPGVGNALNAAASLASNFFDLGRDEIDRKIASLYKWQLEGTVVEVINARLDVRKWTPIAETFNYLIEEIAPASNLSNGDNIGISITLKHFLNIQEPTTGTQKGSKLTNAIAGALNLPNPF
jgi:hypothetical protein